MRVSDVYGGEYLKCIHLQGQDVPVQVESVAVEEVGEEKKRQIVLKFAGQERRLGLCKTNAEQIAAMYGDDTNLWIGQTITLWPDPTVSFGGKAVGGVRVRPVPPVATVTPGVSPVQAASPTQPIAAVARPSTGHAGPVQF
jgi:hypothetical protein